MAAATSPLPQQPLKRRSESHEDGSRAAKRRRRPFSHRHYTHHRQDVRAGRCLEDDDIQMMLTRSLSLALEAAGFDSANLTALESLRAEVDEYMLHFASAISQSMLSSRRIQPTPQDFSHALAREGLSPFDLRPFLNSSIPPATCLPHLPSPPPEEAPPPSLALLEPTLAGASAKAQLGFVPTHLPSFPANYTYKSTPEFTEREKDPRLIRELATDEGRRGEDALRKLLAKGNPHRRQIEGVRGSNTKFQEMESRWEDTLEALQKDTASSSTTGGLLGGHGTVPATPVDLGGLVNCERPYWRESALRGSGQAKTSGKMGTVEDGDLTTEGVGAGMAG